MKNRGAVLWSSKGFVVSPVSISVLGPTQPLIKRVTAALSPGAKWPGRKAHCSRQPVMLSLHAQGQPHLGFVRTLGQPCVHGLRNSRGQMSASV